MDFRDTPEEAAFRDEVRTWLSENLVGEFALIGGGRGTADEEHWDQINRSRIHIDFMIGSPEVDVFGVDADGRETPVLAGGDWQI